LQRTPGKVGLNQSIHLKALGIQEFQDDSPPALFAASVQEFPAAGVKTIPHRPYMPPLFKSFWRQGSRQFPTGFICSLYSGISGGGRGQDDPSPALFASSIQEFLAAAGVKTIPRRPCLPDLFRSFWWQQGSRRSLTGPVCRLYSVVSGGGRGQDDHSPALFASSIREFLAAAGAKTIPHQPCLPALFRSFWRQQGSRQSLTGTVCRLYSGVSGGGRGQDNSPRPYMPPVFKSFWRRQRSRPFRTCPIAASIQEFLAAAGVKMIPQWPYLPPLVRSFWRRQGPRQFPTGPICQLYSGVSGGSRGQDDPSPALFAGSIQEFLAAAGAKTIPHGPICHLCSRDSGSGRGQDNPPMALFATSIQEFLAAAGDKTIPYRPYLPALFRSFWQQQGSRRSLTGPVCRLYSEVSGGSRGQDDPSPALFASSIQEFLAAAGVKRFPTGPICRLCSRVSGGRRGQDDPTPSFFFASIQEFLAAEGVKKIPQWPHLLLLIRSFWRRQGSRPSRTSPICRLYPGVSGGGKGQDDSPPALFVTSVQEFLVAAGVKMIPHLPYLPPLFRSFWRQRGSRRSPTGSICRL
jgi:hypothetical protein